LLRIITSKQQYDEYGTACKIAGPHSGTHSHSGVT